MARGKIRGALAEQDLTTVQGLKAVFRAKAIKVNELLPSASDNPTIFGGDTTLLENLMYADHDVAEETEFLLGRKASVRIGDPLAAAAFTGQIGAIALLIAGGARVNGNAGVKSQGHIPLHSAAAGIENSDLAVQLLLEQEGLNFAKKQKESKNTVFHIAAMARVLRGKAGSDKAQSAALGLLCEEMRRRVDGGARNFINARNAKGETALMIVAKSGDVGIVRELLQCGASRRLANRAGKTAVDLFRGSEEELKEAFKRVRKAAPAEKKGKRASTAKKGKRPSTAKKGKRPSTAKKGKRPSTAEKGKR